MMTESPQGHDDRDDPKQKKRAFDGEGAIPNFI
jgi:hypothetical protein